MSMSSARNHVAVSRRRASARTSFRLKALGAVGVLAALLAVLAAIIFRPGIYSFDGMMTRLDLRLTVLLSPDGQILTDTTERNDLQPRSDLARTVYENDLVQVSMDEQQFLAFGQWAQRNSFQGEIPSLDTLAAAAKADYESRNDDYPQYPWLIAPILRSGAISIYDKRISASVDHIVVWDYAYIWCPVCGSGDWYFSLPDGATFFEENYTKF